MGCRISRYIALCLVLLFSVPAHADTVAISWLKVNEETPSRFAEQAGETISRKLKALSLREVSYEAVEQRASGIELGSCTTPVCVQKLAEQVDADRFLRVVIEASGASYDLVFHVLGTNGATLKRLEDSCPVCTVSEAHETIEQMLEAVMTATRLVAIEIVTEPAGASLTIDGKDVGSSPYQGKLPAGAYVVKAAIAGYVAAEQKIDVPERATDTQRTTISLIEQRDGGDDAVSVDAPGRPFRIVKWVSLTASISGISAGLAWLAVNGREVTCDQDDPSLPQGVDCAALPAGSVSPLVYDTSGRGLIALGSGVGLAAVTAFLFWHDTRASREERALKATVAPTSGGAMATLRLEF